MTVLDLITDPQGCVQLFQRLRWPHGVRCPQCRSRRIKRHGTYRDGLNRYRCQHCGATFNDKTGTILEKSKLPLRKWLQGMYLLSLNCSTQTLAEHLAIHYQSARRMVQLIQGSLLWQRFPRRLHGTVEVDECYLRAGNKGPVRGKKPPLQPRRRGLKQRGRGSFQVDQPPVIGFVERRGKAYRMVVRHVKHQTVISTTHQLVARGSRVYTDDYRSYAGLAQTGYRHRTIQHSRGEHARGRVHTNTVEGVWSLFKTWMRRHRGVSKWYLPGYAATFEFFYNHRHLTPVNQWKRLLVLCLKAPGSDLRKLIQTGRFITLCSP